MQGMSQGEANLDNLKKKIHSGMPGAPFYKELIEEIIKEDFSGAGPDLKQAILNGLKVAEEKPKATKPAINFKAILLDGIRVIGGASNSMTEILAKLEENQAVMASHKKGFLEALKELIRQLTNAPPEEVIYHIEYMDQTKGVPVKEKINFHQFKDDMAKKAKILASFANGPAYQKLSAMNEEQIIGYLERNIKDVQTLHKTLAAMDEFFKAHAPQESRDKIKGIKPELAALKNSYVKANQLRYDYTAQKEEEEQLKRLGVNPASVADLATEGAPAPAAGAHPQAAAHPPAGHPPAGHAPAAAHPAKAK
jgi:hypothetical protein